MNTFEINILLLHKYGWLAYDYPHRYNNPLLEEAVTNYYFGTAVKPNFDVIYFFKNNNDIFLISELCKISNQEEYNNKSKQNQKKEYIFVIYKNKRVKTININSNIELLKSIIKYNACSEDYVRYFKLNKLLR